MAAPPSEAITAWSLALRRYPLGMRTLLAYFLCLISLVHAADGPVIAPAGQTTAYIPIEGMINDLKARYFKRALDDAAKAGCTQVVVHLTTDGGTLDGGRQMLDTALSLDKGKPSLVAFIDNRAYSAGAMIAYGHDRIYLTPQATIGDIGVIFQNKDGGMEYAPEKIESVVRTLLLNAAQNKGWNGAKLVKMTARNQELWRVTLDAGSEWIIGDDLAAFLTNHPELERKEDHLLKGTTRVGEVVKGKDRLMSYTAKDALDERMASGLVDNLDALYRQMGVEKSTVLDLSPTSTESVSWILAGWAPLLAGLAVLFIVLEFKMPGGLFISLAAIAGVAFFICQFYQDLASYVEVLLMLGGIVAVVLDIFILPTGGLLSALGLMLLGSGLVLSFMPNIDQFNPSAEGWGDNLLGAFRHSIFALTMMAAGLLVAIGAAPRLKAMRRLSVQTAIDGTSQTPVTGASLVGRHGVARTGLSPAGFITLDGAEISASSQHGEYVAPGALVEIVELRFGEAVVRPLKDHA